MAACRRIPNFAKKTKIYLYKSSAYYSTSIEVKSSSRKSDDIVIPYRIHRGPTDILKALSSTISKDFTAAQYRYEDDPYFIPASNVAKRAFALSKESGRKSARYFLEKYPEYFKCNTSVPYIKAYDPPVVYTEENVTSADTLIECINNFDVNNCVLVYDILKKKDITVNQVVKQDFLELLCFFNGLQPPDEDYYEERYFQRVDARDIGRWKTKGMAEQLFEDMEKDAKAYSAMIAGASKFQDPDRALFLYDEMKSKGLIPTLAAYNGLISLVPMIKEMGETRWEYTLTLLDAMSTEGLLPDLYTINAVLEMITKCRRWNNSKSVTLTVLSEMKRLNIEPSLGTYSLILYNLCNSDSDIGVLYEILENIEGKEFTARHPLDLQFFSNAMETCKRYARDKNIVYRINKLLETSNNCKLLGNAFHESRYFKNFLKILCEVEDFDIFMKVYEKYVPNTYTPEPSVMFDILQNVHFHGLYKYLPKLCSDVLVFEQTEREHILELAMECAGIMKHEEKTQEELVYIVWKIVEKLNQRLESGRFNFSWTGLILGNILTTFINGEDLEKSWSIVQLLHNNEQNIVGYPEKHILLRVCEFFLQKQEYNKAKFCIKYAVNGAYPDFRDDLKKLTQDMFEKGKLEDKNRVHVNNLLKHASSVEEETLDSSASSNESSSDSSSGDSSSDSSDEEDKK